MEGQRSGINYTTQNILWEVIPTTQNLQFLLLEALKAWEADMQVSSRMPNYLSLSSKRN